MLRPLRPVALRDLPVPHDDVVKKDLARLVGLRLHVEDRLRQQVHALLLEPPLLGHGIPVPEALEGKTHDVGVVHGTEVPDRTDELHEVELSRQVVVENFEDLLREGAPLDVLRGGGLSCDHEDGRGNGPPT